MSDKNIYRKPGVAGLFYSGEENTLEREVAVFLENSPQEEIVTEIFGLVVPHAGYMYSGGVAARSFRQLFERDFDVVVIIAPSHHIYFEEISVYKGSAYETPLGKVNIAQELSKEISDQDENIILSDLGHESGEHSLEVQLPFLQQVLFDFELVAIMMGNQDRKNVDILSKALTKVLPGKNALLVASSDLSHYHSDNKAVLLDKVVIDHINNFDETGLDQDLQKGSCEMCGAGPVMTVMKVSRNLGADKSKVLLYRNSGDVTGERGQVVGYLSAMFY